MNKSSGEITNVYTAYGKFIAYINAIGTNENDFTCIIKKQNSIVSGYSWRCNPGTGRGKDVLKFASF